MLRLRSTRQLLGPTSHALLSTVLILPLDWPCVRVLVGKFELLALETMIQEWLDNDLAGRARVSRNGRGAINMPRRILGTTRIGVRKFSVHPTAALVLTRTPN